jgi:secondary thiamine-phosphate synthase enzyme
LAAQKTLTFRTRGRGTTEITPEVERAVREAGVKTGLCNVFLQHTSASLILCENAAPAVRQDLETLLSRLAPDGDPAYVHDHEGADDMARTHVGAAAAPGRRRALALGLAGHLPLGAPPAATHAQRRRDGDRMTAECIFCRPQREILARNESAIAVFDTYPVSPGHALVLPLRHVVTIWDLDPDEYDGCFRLVRG